MQAVKKHSSLLWCAIFSIAMGYLEAIVVIYLRELYYPQGFQFPITPGMQRIIGFEWLREMATIIMLIAIAIIAGKNKFQRFFYFFYCFGIWDIFYYIALKHLIGWPDSFFTFDILFLIPITWIAPVLAPVICSVIFVTFSFLIIGFENAEELKIKKWQWLIFWSGNLIVFISFVWDFGSLIISNGYLPKLLTLTSDKSFQELIALYIPQKFRWGLFIGGEILVTLFFLLVFLEGLKFRLDFF
ncbi:MAG: hypothetical protein ACP5P3_04155 [Ignavibacteria bacterium]